MKRRRSFESAFTRTDLITVIAVLLLLLSLSPQLSSDLWTQSKVAVCLSNHQQLITGWLMYAEANSGRLPDNVGFNAGQLANSPYKPWAIGWLTFDLSGDNTNRLFLADPRYASLAPYISRNPKLFKCPSDTYLSSSQRNAGWEGRSRTYAMNLYMGAGDTKASWGPGYTIYLKLDQIVQPGPAQAFVFIEEHPDSINDTLFVFDPLNSRFVDVPASHHNLANAFSFADGHVELHRWQNWARWAKPETLGNFGTAPALPPTDPDYRWLKDRATTWITK